MEVGRMIFIIYVIYYNTYICHCSTVTTRQITYKPSLLIQSGFYKCNASSECIENDNVTPQTELIKISQHHHVPASSTLLDSAQCCNSQNNSVPRMGKKIVFPKKPRFSLMSLRESNQISLSKQNSQEENEEEKSLERLLITLVYQNLKECNLIVLTDRSFQYSYVLETVIRLPNIKQVVFMEEPESLLKRLVWLSSICQGILLLLTDPEPLLTFGAKHLFSWDYSAKLIIVGLQKEAVLKFLETKKGKKSENILALLKGELPNHYFVYMNELYWGDRGLRLLTDWDGHIFTKRTVFYPDKISNLHQSQINVAIFEWQPAIFYRRDKENNILLRYGRDVDVVMGLVEAFNFSYVYKETHHEELFGHRLENGSFNGQVGQMYNGEGDIGIANIWLSSLAGRNEFQGYSSIFEVDTSCCMARVEPPLPLWQSPALPFQPQAWLAILVGMIISGPLLFTLANLGSIKEQEHENLRSLTESILYSIGVHISHPMAVLPKNLSTQVYVVFFLLYGLILNTGYTSNLISFLTLPKQPYSINTFREIYESGMIFVGIPYHKDAIKFSNNPYLKELVSTYDVRMRFEDLTGDILAGRAVTLNSKSYLELVGGIVTATSEKPKFRIMRECFAFYSVGIVYQKHSPLKNKFDLMITRMFESGMVRRWFYASLKLYHQFERQDAREKQLLEGGTVPEIQESGVLQVAHVQGVFIIMFGGLFVSVIIFAVETLAYG